MEGIDSKDLVIFSVGLIQLIFALVMKNANDRFKRIENALDKQDARITDNSKKDEEDNNQLRAEMVGILDKHYVTTGQLSTLEEKLMGEIKSLTTAIEGLTDAIRRECR